jgi:hypothetical protein
MLMACFLDEPRRDLVRVSPGRPEPAGPGLLKAVCLGRLGTGQGRPAVLQAGRRGMDFRDRPHTCRGRVISTVGNRAELELWGEDDTGRRTTLGRAEVIDDEEIP